MVKPLAEYWFLQAVADTAVAHLAPGRRITPIVHPEHGQIKWDDESESVGRAPWHVGYFFSPHDSHARALLPLLNAAIGNWRARYDLRVCRV
jgi:hypothetical protein